MIVSRGRVVDMKTYVSKVFLVLFTLVLCACKSVELQDYTDTRTAFDLPKYFEGNTQAWGLVQDYSGKVTRRFHVRMEGKKTPNGQLVLDEYFTYDDGEKQFRQWTIKANEEGYLGAASDIVGVAKGAEQGFAVRWQYQMDLTVDGEVYRVSFDDWMYKIDDKHAFNKADIKKWGVTVGQVTLFFQKP